MTRRVGRPRLRCWFDCFYNKFCFKKFPCIPKEDLSGVDQSVEEIYLQVQGIKACPPGTEKVLRGSQKYIDHHSSQESSLLEAPRLSSISPQLGRDVL